MGRFTIHKHCRPKAYLGFTPDSLHHPAFSGGKRVSNFSRKAASTAGGIGGEHAPLLLAAGNLDQRGARNLMVAPALVADLLGQACQRQDLAYGAAGLADDGAHLLLRVEFLRHQPLKGLGLLDGDEILPLYIFNQRNLGVVSLDADARHGQEAKLHGRLVAPFARHDDQPPLLAHAKQNRREDAQFADGLLQVVEGGGVDHLARLIGVGPQVGNGKLVQIAFFVLWRGHDHVLPITQRVCMISHFAIEP